KHLEQIRKRRRIFKRMRTIRIEEAAAVRAEHLDGLLRGDRALGDSLRGDNLGRCLSIRAGRRYRLGLHKLCRVIRPKVLDNALRHKKQRIDKTRRKQYPEARARSVDPEVPECLRLAP